MPNKQMVTGVNANKANAINVGDQRVIDIGVEGIVTEGPGSVVKAFAYFSQGDYIGQEVLLRFSGNTPDLSADWHIYLMASSYRAPVDSMFAAETSPNYCERFFGRKMKEDTLFVFEDQGVALKVVLDTITSPTPEKYNYPTPVQANLRWNGYGWQVTDYTGAVTLTDILI